MEKDTSCNWRQRIKAGVAILVLDKTDFKTRTTATDKERYCVLIKGSTQEEDIIVNIYAFNIGVPEYIKKILTDIKGDIDSNKIVENINTPLISMNRPSRQKINEETATLNDTLGQMDIKKYIQIISSPNNRIHFPFRCTGNHLKDRSHAYPNKKSQQI